MRSVQTQVGDRRCGQSLKSSTSEPKEESFGFPHWAQGTQIRMTLHGTLEDFSSGGILRVLSSDGRTGALTFGDEAGCVIYLHHGQLYFARDDRTDAALTAALVRPGRLTAEDWGAAVEEAGDRALVGELLLRNGAIHPDLLASVVLSVVYDPLISLFLAGVGDFEFEPDVMHWFGPFRAFPVDVIVGEVRRRVREVDEWGPVMPTLDVSVGACRTLPGDADEVTLGREDWELVAALVKARSIDELATDLGRGRYSTARIVYRLSRAGLVEVTADRPDGDAMVLSRVDPPTPAESRAPVDPMSVGRPPMAHTTPELLHRSPAGAVRPRRRGEPREAGRAGVRRSHESGQAHDGPEPGGAGQGHTSV